MEISENLIKNIICTLNQIDVHGKDNLDKLLGCIMVLERALAEATNQEKEVSKDG